MRAKITALLLLLATAFCAVLSQAEFPRFLLAFELLFGAAMLFWVHWVAKRISAALTLDSCVITRGEKITVRVSLKNPTAFPVSDLRILGEIKMSAGQPVEGHTGAAPKSTDTWQVQVQPLHCAVVKIRIVELRVFDYLGVFSAKLKNTGLSAEVSVLPPVFPLVFPEEFSGFSGRGQDSESMAARAGEDSQEIFDTRLYQRGDELRKIHWKLSAKLDDLMVKEFSMPQDFCVPVVLDPKVPDPEKVTLEETDAFYDLAAALGNYLLGQRLSFAYCWILEERGDWEILRVSEEREFRRALEALLTVRPGKDGIADGPVPGLQAAEPVRVTWRGVLQKGGQPLRYTLGQKA